MSTNLDSFKINQITIFFVLAILLQAETGFSTTLNIAYFSKDVPSIEPLSPAFDPDSYAVITQIFDTLVYLDREGQFQPQLASSWRQLSDLSWEFNLRKGVVFHNNEPFDGHAVKFTYEYALDPNNKAGNAWILSTIKSVDVDPDDPYRVVIHTVHPDGMFLNRLNMFGSICPPQYIKQYGIEHFFSNPIGTGPYRFTKWQKGHYIELTKNRDYWQTNIPSIETIKFKVLPENQWVNAFLEGKVDFIPNLSGNQTSMLMHAAQGEAKILKRLVLSGYWVLLKNHNALADIRVRKALNHAVNKEHLVKFGDFGNAKPLASLGKIGEFGQNKDIKSYKHDPEQAIALLKEAGIEDELHLSAIVADIAGPVAQIIRQNLKDAGIHLELDIVPRSEWANRVVGHKILTGEPADYDLAINLVDNPIHNLAFHAGLFLFSKSPWSLLNSPDYDKKYLHALQTADSNEHRKRLEALDQYIHEEALMLFTTQRVITAAVRSQFNIPKFSLNGHLDYEVLTTATHGENQLNQSDNKE